MRRVEKAHEDLPESVSATHSCRMWPNGGVGVIILLRETSLVARSYSQSCTQERRETR